MRLKLTVFCMFFTSLLLAQSMEKEESGYDPNVDIISDKYEAGPYLIYDCEDKRWVCVLEEYFKACQQKRDEDLHRKKNHMRCAPIVQYPVKKSCFQRSLFLTTHHHGTRFCLGEGLRGKDFRF